MSQPPDPSAPRSFETEIRVQASRDAVWEAIATDTGLMRWFAPTASIDPAVGGEVVWDWDQHHRWAQRIEILEPGRRLQTRYDSSVDDAKGGKKPLWIDFLLEGDGGTTTLRLVQSGFGTEAGFEEEYDGISRGWPVELCSLRLSLEHHPGVDRQVVWATYDVDDDPRRAWQRLTSEEGLGCGADIDQLGSGSALSFTSADGDRYEGEVLAQCRGQLTAMLQSHGNAFFRISAERWGGMTHVWCWLGAYGQDRDQLAALQTRWETRLTKLFANHGAQT